MLSLVTHCHKLCIPAMSMQTYHSTPLLPPVPEQHKQSSATSGTLNAFLQLKHFSYHFHHFQKAKGNFLCSFKTFQVS